MHVYICTYICILIRHLEGVKVDGTVGATVLPNLVQQRQHGYVGLAGASGGAEQHILCREEGRLVDRALDAVQARHALKRWDQIAV